MKRALDVTASAVGLVILSPVLSVVAFLVRATSPGPALYRQIRVGRNGSRFEILKFRTMRVGTLGAEVTTGDDNRLTQIGHLLRKTKIDELPQLLNVLRGDMSLVGPRPEVPKFTRHWAADQAATILRVRPGITDPASILFRNESSLMTGRSDPEAFYIEHLLPLKAEMYVDYVRHRTLLGDLRLIFITVSPLTTPRNGGPR